MGNPENSEQNSETPQERYEELVVYYEQAYVDGRNRNRFPNNLKPEEITNEKLYKLSIYMNEGWIGVTNTNIIEPQIKDSWFRNQCLPGASASAASTTTGEATASES